PSKTDTERLLVISPELADVLSTIVARIRGDRPDVPLVISYDKNERVYNPPMPLLFNGGADSTTAPSARPYCAPTSTTRSPRSASKTPPANRCATPSTTSDGCSSPTPS